MTGREPLTERKERAGLSAGPAPAFDLRGHEDSLLPVLLSVPHAGREYPSKLLERSRVPMDTLRRLEDRFADLLLDDAIDAGCSAIVARIARAAIDLNRDPRDIDSRMVATVPRGTALIQSVKQRGGLGLFPRSLPRSGDIWHRRLPWQEAIFLIRHVHVPYHQAISTLLRSIHARHGCALLIDVHSMPPIAPSVTARPRPDIVIGDRFGVSASARFADVARSVVADHGYSCAVNHPYPGFYVLERHGAPIRGIQALQIEISRDLYLDDSLHLPGPGLASLQALLAELVCALADEAGSKTLPIAAE